MPQPPSPSLTATWRAPPCPARARQRRRRAQSCQSQRARDAYHTARDHQAAPWPIFLPAAVGRPGRLRAPYREDAQV
eukprot:scaffold24333_cov33-Tisochrysis_lutea.AAC.2